MNILIISSLSRKSGSAIRNRGVCLGLKHFKHNIRYLEPHSAKIFTMLIGILRSILFKHDVIIAMKPFPNACLPAILSKYIRGSKIILDIDDAEYLYYKNKFVKKLFEFFHRYFPKYFDRVTVHNYELKRFVQEKKGGSIGERSIIFLSQGVNPGMFQDACKDSALKEKLGLKDSKVMIYAAHLGAASSLLKILYILKGLAEKRNNLKLLVIGGGRHLEYYKSVTRSMGIADRVIFTEYLKHADAIRYMALGDVALNYFDDTECNRYRSPIKIREYLASGIPVVCNKGGDVELFSKFVDICDDIEEYKTRILEALDNPPYKKTEDGRQFVLKQYDWIEAVRPFEKELRELVKE